MSTLVGDLILELRSRIPDAPAVHNPPIIVGLTGANVPGGALAPNSTHAIAATITTHWGETAAVYAPAAVTLGPADNAIIATITFSGSQAQSVNVYEATDAQTLSSTADLWTFPAVPGTANYVVGLNNNTLIHTALPSRSTAFLPDTDGNFIGGYMCYRLLNRALAEMVKIGGGIVDVTGVRTTVNQSMYRLDSPFYTFTNAWYDGYPMDVVQRSMMFLRNSAAGFSGILSYEQDGPQQVIQVWPQSNRTGGSTVLTAPLDMQANSFQVADRTGFLSIGLARIDDEVVVFSSGSGNTEFNGVTRGMGGTEIASHQAGAEVTELNLRLSGYRLARQYNVGESGLTLMVPQSWETCLVLHMLSQVRSIEQDDATAQKLLSDFQAQAEKIAKGSRLGRLKPRQIPIWGQNVSDARSVNGVGFGWLVQ